ncbi:hypothetical protein PR202_gb12306 [Eleusine coracana subsp. coracana]|uniref:DUF1618 domain-containing protein n=1 Tax=Eleusine coracana subsp. coracana TaxID=191504 RepID=A0AAV5EP81_ELECO|nr:hypothetical protein PR202_gb12306 [Eleusine coracana subsp. coracana]
MEGGPIDSPSEVLVDRFVPLIDEIAQVIQEGGGQPLVVATSSALKDVPPSLRQRVMLEEVLQYREAVEEPAAAIVRERKALRPSAGEKLAVAFSGNDDPFIYGEALDGVEIQLDHIAQAPEISHLALRVSWPPSSRFRSFPPGGLIISTDRNMLLLYVGPYRPGISSQGFYLVYDARANSIAVIPPLPSRSLSMFSQCGIGTGGAILFHGVPGEYLLAELFLQRNRGRTSNKATLFMWRSSGGAVSCCWTQKEVTLPLPSGTTVRAGIEGRGLPVVHRSMCCIERGGGQMLKFVSVNGYGKCQDHRGLTINCWTTSVMVPQWQNVFSFRYGELEADSAVEFPRLMPTYPMLSIVDDIVMYITVAADLESTNGRPEDRGRYMLSLDTSRGRILSSFKLPATSGRVPVNILASTVSCYMKKTNLVSEVQHKHQKETDSSSSSAPTSAV